LDPLRFIKVNFAFNNFSLFNFFKTFEQNGVFYVLQDVHIDVLQHLGGLEPLGLVLLVKVAIPNPEPPVEFSVLLLAGFLFLLLSQEPLIAVLLFFLQSTCHDLLGGHFRHVLLLGGHVRCACFLRCSLPFCLPLFSLCFFFLSKLNVPYSHDCSVSRQFWYHRIDNSLVCVQ